MKKRLLVLVAAMILVVAASLAFASFARRPQQSQKQFALLMKATGPEFFKKTQEPDGKILATDGPFTETKEQLAGYYILDCASLDEAIAWASKIPTGCQGGDGCIEIRPIRTMKVVLD